MKIEFGCGETPTKTDFLTCDIRNLPGVDFVCNAWEINNYVENNSVEYIFSRHFFEHLTFRQGEEVLKIWYDILVPGGFCDIEIPNMQYHIEQWVTEDDLNWCRAGFWGWQRGEFSDLWDTHKSGYNKKQLKNLLTSKGFKDLEDSFYEDTHWNLRIRGKK